MTGGDADPLPEELTAALSVAFEILLTVLGGWIAYRVGLYLGGEIAAERWLTAALGCRIGYWQGRWVARRRAK